MKNSLEIHIKENDKVWHPLKVTGLKNIQQHLEQEVLKSSYILYNDSIAKY